MDWAKLKFWNRSKEVLPPSPPAPVLSLSVPITRMKWVVLQQTSQIGIVTKCEDGGMVNVDLVKEDGTTFSSVRTAIGNVRIARLAEIPACRHPNTVMEANLLGYY